jgi:hypothetical protein
MEEDASRKQINEIIFFAGLVISVIYEIYSGEMLDWLTYLLLRLPFVEFVGLLTT